MDVSPASEPLVGEVLARPKERFAPIAPMYRELLAVDLPTVARVAVAHSLDVQQARARVDARRGQAQSAAGTFLPTLAPTALFEQVDGSVRATQGNLVDASFSTFQPYLLAQMLVNPGKAAYDLVAARKRVLVSQYQERAVVVETLRAAAQEYDALVLAQYRIAAARQSIDEAQELMRITQSRQRAGVGIAADNRRAEADLALRRQDLVVALHEFERVSVALALTLELDARVTLAPSDEPLAPRTLVRPELTIDELVELAVGHRDDLKAVRLLVEAAGADAKAAFWSGFGPTVLLGGQIGGIAGHAEDVTGLGDVSFGLHRQERFTAAASAKIGLSSFGELATADAAEHGAAIEAQRALARVRAELVSAERDCKAERELAPMARQELDSAEEVLRLARAGLEAGTATTLDVLDGESRVAQARLRHAEAVAHFDQAQVALLAALGLLDARALGAVE